MVGVNMQAALLHNTPHHTFPPSHTHPHHLTIKPTIPQSPPTIPHSPPPSHRHPITTRALVYTAPFPDTVVLVCLQVDCTMGMWGHEEPPQWD